MSRNPDLHSYTAYTGQPYVYYNGVPIEMNFHCTHDQYTHPYRTIIQTNENNTNINRIMARPDVNPYSLYMKTCHQ